MIIKDRDLLNEDGSIPPELLSKCIENHLADRRRYEALEDYYEGRHNILDRTFTTDGLPNNKLVCNHAQYITDMAVSYVFGTPVAYAGDNIDELNDIFTKIDEDSHNNELALDLSIFGVGYELVYMNQEEKPTPTLAVLSPLNTFLVCDDTVENNPIFAVNYHAKLDINDTVKGYDITVYTESEIIKYFVTDLYSRSFTEQSREMHYFNDVPVIEYKNNKKLMGDFEGVITLIDAYNVLQSDRVNDKEQLVDAILAVSGMSLGDDNEEVTETERAIKELKLIELDEGGDAKWITKQLNETETEVLKKSIKDDIHEFSKVPCLTDENFVGNASGVAMKYKLLGFEQLGKTKERYFKQGLRKRLQLISNIANIQSKNMDVSDIDITMKRSLPVDDELQARVAQETDGFISWETRVKRFDEELDVDAEKKRLDEERQQNIELQQKAFGSYEFSKGVGEDADNNMDTDSST